MFKNTLPTKLFCILFPIEDLRQVVKIAKRKLTKEKLHRQLTGQMTSTPFMSTRDGCHRRISFDIREELGDKIDKLVVMIGKLATRDGGTNRQPKSIRVEVEVKTEITIRETIKTGTDQTAETEDNTDKTKECLDINKIIEEVYRKYYRNDS